MECGFNCGIWGNIFAVPDIVADNFLKLSTDSQLKVLIYLLRNKERMVDTLEISKALDFSEDEVMDAVIFWQQSGILPDNENSELPTVNSIFSAPATAHNEIQPEQTISSNRYSSAGVNLTPSEISDMIEDSPAIKDLFTMAEKYLGNLNFAVQRSLIWMNQYLGLPPDVIIMIISYCISAEQAYVGAMDAIAYSWSRNGITTLMLAQNEINNLKETAQERAFIVRMKRILHMGCDPVPKQKKFLMKWKSENYSDDLIQCAYCKTMEATGNPVRIPIEYIDAILKRWKSNNINTLEQAEKDDTDFKSLFPKKNGKENSDKKSIGDEFEEKYKIFLNNY